MNTVNQSEIEHFESMAGEWWDENGPLKPLHKLNPVRISYIKRQICAHFGRDYEALDALNRISVLDFGCGGGLVCEPLARLGGTVTGIDAGKTAIEVAQEHAKENNLDITYCCETSDVHRGQYDVVLALEIIEHVDNVTDFVASLSKLVKPDGIIILSTLNRTTKSFALGIIAAEYILRWLPTGTHDWKKFMKPSEMAKYLAAHGLKPTDITGLRYNPLMDRFALDQNDIDVNYFMTACFKK